MIANSQLTVQSTAGRPALATNKADKSSDSGENQSAFKDVLEQGIRSAEEEKSGPAKSREATSTKRLSGFETHAEFAASAQVHSLETAPVQQTGELDLQLAGEMAIGAGADGTELMNGQSQTVASGADALEDTVRSIVNTLTTRPADAGLRAAAMKLPVSDGEQALSEQVSASAKDATQLAAAQNDGAAQIVAANQTNATSTNFMVSQRVSNTDARRIGLDLDNQKSAREALDNLPLEGSVKGDTEAKNNESLASGFAEVKKSTRGAIAGQENRNQSINSAKNRIEPGTLAAVQASTQVAGAANDAPPPVKDQVLDRLGPEIRSMYKTDTTSAAQASGVAAANRNVISLQLYPIGLGRVQARLTKDGDGVKIDLTVESKQTLDLLNADIDALKSSMRALGASESNISIVLGRNNNSANQEAALENGDPAKSENAMAGDSEADGRNHDQDGDLDGQKASLQPSIGAERTGYDSTRIII